MKSVVNGLIAACLPLALMLIAHYTLHKPDPPLWHALVFALQWAIIGVAAHTSRLGLPVFWSAVFWSLLIGLLGAAWGTYFGRGPEIYISLELPQLVGGLAMAPLSAWLEKRA